MMNINVSGADNIVSEYLIYRGFTQTFQSLQQELSKDRTKRFEVSRIVDAIFQNLNSFEIESFVSLWDFLNKRFFYHLDGEHLHLCGILKTDLLKYYLVHALKVRRKEKITEFFSMYSHEILAENGNQIAGNLRGWFVLPYMDEPEKDSEFSIYFAQRWSDLLKVTVHNFLSVVLSSAPPPKLLLLERWFRSEAQQEIRAQLKYSAKKVETLSVCLEAQEQRLHALREVLSGLVVQLQKLSPASTIALDRNTVSALTTAASSAEAAGNRSEVALSTGADLSSSNSGSNSINIQNSNSCSVSGSSRKGAVGLFDADEVAEEKRTRARILGQYAVKAATECWKQSSVAQSLPKEEKLQQVLSRATAKLLFDSSSNSSGLTIRSLDPNDFSSRDSMYELITAANARGGSANSSDQVGMVAELEADLIRQVHDWLSVLSSF